MARQTTSSPCYSQPVHAQPDRNGKRLKLIQPVAEQIMSAL